MTIKPRNKKKEHPSLPRPSNKRINLSKPELDKAIELVARGWQITQVAAFLNRDSDNLTRRLKQFRQRILSKRVGDLSKIESKAFQLAEKGNVQMQKFLLERLVRDRYGAEAKLTIEPVANQVKVYGHEGKELKTLEIGDAEDQADSEDGDLT